MVVFVELPNDILLNIALHLAVSDLLSLKQTCRVLHVFGGDEYLWHRLIEKFDLPLDVSANIPHTRLSAEELQPLAIKALRLQRNWRSPSTKIRRATSLVANKSDDLFEHMQFVPGGKWLLTVQGHFRRFENRNCAIVSLWSLRDVQDAQCAVQFELPGKLRSAALSMDEGETSATFAIALHDVGRDFIIVRKTRVQECSSTYSIFPPQSGALTRCYELPYLADATDADLIIEGISVNKHVMMATVAIINSHQDISGGIIFANMDTGCIKWMSPFPKQARALLNIILFVLNIPQIFSLPLVRLQDDKVIVFGRQDQALLMRLYDLPDCIMCKCPSIADTITHVEWGEMLFEYLYTFDRMMPDITFIPSVFTTFLSCMLFDDTNPERPYGCIVRFPLKNGSKARNRTDMVECMRVPIPADTSIQLAEIGITGRRAVWLEHSLDTTRSRLMKLEVGTTEDGDKEIFTFGVLLSPDSPVPFSTNACHTLAFDEVTGRLCLGLWDGSLHILDFV